MTTEIFQSECQIFKRISGKWLGGCGFLDGEKLICMDGLYEDVITTNCLVYSFGVGKYNLEGAIIGMVGFRSVCFLQDQEKKRERKPRLTTKNPDYQLGWAVMALCRQLDILKRNFHFTY